jgi:hypothetical protein
MLGSRRNPLVHITLIALICLLGIGSRRYAQVFPGFIAAYAPSTAIWTCQVLADHFRYLGSPFFLESVNVFLLRQQKRTERFSLGLRCLAPVLTTVGDIPEETIHHVVFLKMPLFQPELLNVRHDRGNQISGGSDKTFQLRVKRALPQIIVQISDQMNKALLLTANTRIVASVEI